MDRVDRDEAPTDEVEAAAITAWRKLDAAHSRVSQTLTQALRHQHGLSINAHAVLAELLRAPDGRLRMTEIATRIDFSLSGLTGLVGRLEQDGLVERQADLADRRVIFASLTEHGRRAAMEAREQHHAALHDLFRDHFTERELDQLTTLLTRLTPAPRHGGRRLGRSRR